jgi:predicted signal transduction protein with EAL and GGDEF domain
LAPVDGTNPERLLKSSDLALYKAKAEGRNCVRFFVAEVDTEVQTRFKLEKMISEAVLDDRFELHYQPLFEISKRRLIGFEALRPFVISPAHPTVAIARSRCDAAQRHLPAGFHEASM